MISVFWPGRATLGEGPLWDGRVGTLYWVDILAGRLYRQQLEAAGPETLDVGSQLGCLGLTSDPGVLICGTREGWQLVELATGARRLLADPEADRPDCRFNDGAVDPSGGFWTGSLEDSESGPLGRLYRLGGDGTVTEADRGFYCSNGIDWSPDGRWMYFIDSWRNVIYRYAFDAGTGVISERGVFADTTGLDGVPDGLRVDSAGDVWCAFWDGAQLVRFAPDGSVRDRIPLPVLRPTSIAFGGADRRTAFVTSASRDLSPDELAKWPLSGAVLQLQVDVAGQQSHRFHWTGDIAS